MGDRNIQKMDWRCSACAFRNRGSNDVCGGAGPVGCKAPRPDMMPAQAGDHSMGDYSMVPMLASTGEFEGQFAMDELQATPTGHWEPPAAFAGCGYGKAKGKGKGTGNGKASHYAPYGQVSPAAPVAPRPHVVMPEKPSIVRPPAALQSSMLAFTNAGPAVASQAKWRCTLCGFNNSPSNDLCGGAGPLGCKASKAIFGDQTAFITPAIEVSLDKSPLWCDSLDTSQLARPVNVRGDKWVCPSCGFANVNQNDICGGKGPLGCKNRRPGLPPPRMVPPPVSRPPPTFPEPEWVCECGFINKARNDKCGGNGPMGCNKRRFEPTVVAPNNAAPNNVVLSIEAPSMVAPSITEDMFAAMRQDPPVAQNLFTAMRQDMGALI